MSLSPAPAEPAAVPAQPIAARVSLVATVANAIVRAQGERRFGQYDYSKYPGDAPPYVIRDEIDRRELYRSWDHEECSRTFEQIKKVYVAERVLGAIVEFYEGRNVA